MHKTTSVIYQQIENVQYQHTNTRTHTYSKYTSSCSHLPTQSDSPISVLSPAEIMLPSGNTHIIIVAYAQRLGRDARRLNATVALFSRRLARVIWHPSELASGAAIIALKSARAKKTPRLSQLETGAVGVGSALVEEKLLNLSPIRCRTKAARHVASLKKHYAPF